MAVRENILARYWQDREHVLPWKFHPSSPSWAYKVTAGQNHPLSLFSIKETKAWYFPLCFNLKLKTWSLVPSDRQSQESEIYSWPTLCAKPTLQNPAAGWMPCPGQRAGPCAGAPRTRHGPSTPDSPPQHLCPSGVQCPKAADNHFTKTLGFFLLLAHSGLPGST